MGDAELADSNEHAALYFALFPQAKAYQQTHDFHFYRIKVARVRFIAASVKFIG